MTGHVSEDLPLLLTGDANRDVVLTAAAHLRVCEDCRLELVSAVVAHASLMSAHRFAPEVVTAAGLEDDVAAAQAEADADAEAGTASDKLPDMSSLFAEAHADAAAPTPAATPRRRLRVAALAAAAAVVVGGGVTYAAVGTEDGPVTRTVALQPFDRGSEPATVQLVGNDTMKVDASKLPKLDSRHLYEVWLTTEKRMQPVGVIGSDNTAVLPVTSKVMSRYKHIQVSIQRVDQTKFSGISVLRGTYG